MERMARIKDDKIQIRIDVELKNRINKAAEAQGRTLSNFVLYIVKQYLDNNGF